MMRRSLCVWMVAAAMGLAGAWGVAAEAEEAAAAAPAEEQPDLARALAGFKGFLVGELVEVRDEGVTLLVRAVTIIEGNAAANPGLLVGRPTLVAFATEKNDDGNEQPVPGLVRAVKQIQRMPAIQFGGLGGNAVIMMEAPEHGADGAGRNVRVTAQRMVMRVNGGEVRLGAGEDDDPDDPEAARKPQGPLMTARVRAGDDGTLVMDRVAPGSTPAHTWGAMPEFRFVGADDAAAEPVPKLVPGPFVDARDAEAIEFKARGHALKAQMKALSQQLAILGKQAAREGLPEAHRDALRRQQAELQQRIAQLKDQMVNLKAHAAQRKAEAVARKRQAELRKRREAAEDRKDTDF